jgi:hypothetical protein
MSVKSLGALAICLLLLLVFSTAVSAESEKVLPPELNNDAFKNACLQCHVFSGEYYGDYPKRRKGSIYGEKVGEDAKLGFTTRKNGTDLANIKRQKIATMMSLEVLIALIDANMMAPMTEKEKESVIVAAKVYRNYAEENLKKMNKS